MDYKFQATELNDTDYVIVELPNNISVCINRGDTGYSVDFRNSCTDTIVQMGWVADDDLDLTSDED
jgi:hypothetical protein